MPGPFGSRGTSACASQSREACQAAVLDELDGEERDDADNRAKPERDGAAAREQLVVVEPVLLVPEAACRRAGSWRPRCYRNARRTSRRCPRRLGPPRRARARWPASCCSRTPSTPCRPPARAGPPPGSGLRAVEHADVVQPEEPAAEDVVARGVLAVHPPGEIHEQLVEDPLEETPGRAFPAAPSILYTRQQAQACTGGFTSPKSHS